MENTDLATAQDWLQKHTNAYKMALKAGDTQAANVLRQKAMEAGTLVERLKMVEEMPTSERVLAGIGQGMSNVGRQVKNMLGFTSDEELKQASELDQPLLGTKSGKVGSFIGETAATLPAGGIAGAGTKALGANLAKNLIARGATEGAIQGTVLGGPDKRLEGATQGAIFGMAVPAAGSAYKRIASGVPVSKEARVLMNKGVDLTPGLAAPKSTVNTLEQLATKLPLGIKGKRDEAWKQTQQAILKEVSPPNVAPPAYADLQHSISDLQKKYNQEYDAILDGWDKLQPVVLTTTGKSPQLKDVLVSGLKKYGSPDEEVQARKFLNNILGDLNKSKTNGYLSAKSLQDARSKLRTEAFAQKKAGKHDLANIYNEAQDGITQVLDSQLPADVMQSLKAVDTQYGKFKIVEAAQAAARDAEGGFTPAAFSRAVQQSVPSKGQYAAGGGRLRDLSSAAYRTFTPTMPQTGVQMIPAAAASGLAGLGATVASPFMSVPAALAAALSYTKPGMKAVLGQTAPQQMLRDVNRAGRRALTKDQREALARLLRTGSVNYMLDQAGQE